MSSIVVNGDTSGAVTLSAPTVAGTVTVTLPSASGTMAVSGGSTSFTDLAYTGTLTGSTGVVNIGSGQFYKDASGNVGLATSSPRVRLDVRSDAVIAAPTPLANAVASGVFAIGDSVGSVVGLQLNGSSYDTYIQSRNMGAGSTAYNLLLQPLGGNVGIGTSSPAYKLDVQTAAGRFQVQDLGGSSLRLMNSTSGGNIGIDSAGGVTLFYSNGTERARIDSSGNLLVGTTSTSTTTVGIRLLGSLGIGEFTASSDLLLTLNRLNTDGDLVIFRQDNSTEGSISVSGTTVSYNGGHLSRWAQITTAKDESLVKGTVLSNLDEMNVYTDADGNPVDNEQLNKVKVSDVEGDANVAGVFVNWSYDDAHDVDEINMAMTGDMIIRIAQGTTVARGDLLMSAGDGTAKPQGDDIVRSKTVAKVTSTYVTCTYADGSYCVPCVLMAC
jgi:hypothetical protein